MKSNERDRTVYRRSEGKWVNKRHVSPKPPKVYPTQQDAIRAATRCLMIEGGGDLTVVGADWRIRSKDTILPPSHDPFPPRVLDH